ncbi:obscurin-like [Tachysurus fulvidraco]|uniref:obscurin-like n=1 Tax=Tachysurus fulvidraco TaxID=1234273 RepID=UPI001FEE322B|nr:obscurin-like [Tachysurus fulvidraco]
MELSPLPVMLLLISLIPVVQAQGSPKAVVSIKPDTHVFTGEAVTLICVIQGGGNTQWTYSWNKDNKLYSNGNKRDFIDKTMQVFRIRSVEDSDSGTYSCRGHGGYNQSSVISDDVTLTVSVKPKPTVRVNPQSSVYTGDTVTLSCDLQQGTGWKFQWYRNNQWLQNLNSEQVNTLNVTVDNAGETEYTCEAYRRNYKYYSTELSDPVKITVRVKPKPTVRVNPQSSVYTGDTVTLSCDLQQGTGWEFQWYKNNQELWDLNSEQVNTLNVTVDNAGETEYRCWAHRRNYNYYDSYYSTELSDPVKITVRVKPKPTVRVNPQSSVYTGDTVTLSCELQQGTGWEFYWYRNNQLLQNLNSKQVNTLNVTVDNAGETEYKCRAYRRNYNYYYDNYQTEFSDPVKITVRVKPKPTVRVNPQSSVYTGDTVTLSCELQQGTGWEFYWYNNNQLLQNLNIEQVNTLNVTVDNAGETEYKCGAYRINYNNNYYYTELSDPVKITVRVKPKPTVRVNPQSSVYTGDTVTLSCELQQGTGWEFYWYRNNQRLQNLNSEQVNTLNVTVDNVGETEYTCRARRRNYKYYYYTEYSDPVKITVRVRPKPTVRVNPQSSVYTGDTVTLSCELQQGTGWEFYWYINNNQWLQNQNSEQVNTLKVTVDNAGETEYTCRAYRRNYYNYYYDYYYTELSDPVKITVRVRPKPTVRVNPQSSIYTGDTVTLSCDLQQGTGWEFYWYKNNRWLQNQNSEQVNTLNVTVDNAGETEYRCWAHRINNNNNYYTALSDPVKITVRVKPKPTVRVNPQSSVYTGDTVTLSCDLQQETGWEFYWYKNNNQNLNSEQVNTLKVTVDNAGETEYKCRAHRINYNYYTEFSDPVKITVRVRPKPTVRVNPQSSVYTGDTVTLSCELQQGTGWEFYCYKNNQWLQNLNSEQVNTLKVTVDNAGETEYRCQAYRINYNNNNYYTELSDPVKITVRVKPKVTVRVNPQSSVYTGNTVTLSCEMQQGTGWEIQWYKNNQLLQNLNSEQVNTLKVTVNNAGETEYRCWAHRINNNIYYMTQFSDPVKITVRVKPKPTVRVNPQSSVYTGDTVTLSCELQQGTGWKFYWYKNNQWLRTSEQVNTLNVTVDNAGETEYRCQAYRINYNNDNYYTELSDPVKITVRVKPKPTVRVNPQSSVYTGDTVTLSCELQQGTGWEFYWYRNNQLLQNLNSEQVNTLNVTVDNAGETEYRCWAHRINNSIYYMTQFSDPVKITVRVKPKPTVRVNPQSSVYTGDTVTLSCDLQQGTGWKFQWYNNNQLLWDLNSEQVNTLKVTVDNAGETEYKCRAHRINYNYYFTEFSDPVKITVRVKPKPTVRVNPQSSVYTGDTVTLSCELQQGTGWEFYWYKNNQLLQNLNSEQVNTLNVTVDNAGETEYRCWAHRINNYNYYMTQFSDPVKITVRVKPKPTVRVNPQSSVYTGDTVTLSCDLQQGTGWEFYWYKNNQELQNLNSEQVNTLKVTVDNAGETEYKCQAYRRNYYDYYYEYYYTELSDPVKITVRVKPKLTVRVNPQSSVYTGDTVTLRCDIQDESVSSWQYSWYKDTSHSPVSSEQVYSISGVEVTHTGTYTCRGTERGGSRSSHSSDVITLTVSERPQAVLSVSPHSWLTEGDSVTLSCEVTDSSTDWTFSWYTVVPYRDGLTEIKNNRGYIVHVELLSDSSRGSGGNYTLSPAALNHTGVYMCRGERGEPAFYTQYSNLQPLWITGESPPVSLIINPSRTQHFTKDSLSLSCEDQSKSTGWTVRRYTHSERVLDCSHWGSVTGSTCNISFLSTSYTGVYWCVSESGENSNPVNITVHDGDVILESPVHPVTEGHPLTLRCLYHNPNPSILRADFYKDGSVLQNQSTGEMIIQTVSKSDEGFYHCKHPERGESLKSWVSVRFSGPISNDGTFGLVVGLGFLFIAFLILMMLLWSYKRKKEKQKTNQTSELNQNQSGAEDSQSGHTPLQAGSANIYDTVDESAIRVTGAYTDVTYAEIELKPMLKTKRIKGAYTDVTYAEIELKPMLKTKRIKETAIVGDEPVYSLVQMHVK